MTANGLTLIPAVFNAAGLMVPEPSTKSAPIPLFMDVDTDVVYIARGFKGV